jgi:hypothetical protein
MCRTELGAGRWVLNGRRHRQFRTGCVVEAPSTRRPFCNTWTQRSIGWSFSDTSCRRGSTCMWHVLGLGGGREAVGMIIHGVDEQGDCGHGWAHMKGMREPVTRSAVRR